MFSLVIGQVADFAQKHALFFGCFQAGQVRRIRLIRCSDGEVIGKGSDDWVMRYVAAPLQSNAIGTAPLQLEWLTSALRGDCLR
jgi:hypothetical protein